jgi:hypothetical protein
MPTNYDYARISDSLTGVFDDNRTGNFYTQGTDAFLAYAEDEQDQSNGGKYFSVMVQGRGNIASNSSYSEAGGASTDNEFQIPVKTETWRATWTEDAMLRAMSNDMATGGYDLVKEKIELAQDDCKQRFGIHLGGKGWGSLAGIFAVTTGANGTITVGVPDGTSATAVPEYARRFSEGDQLYAADLESAGPMKGTIVAGSLTKSQDVATIVSINHQTGVLTCDTVPATFATGDYIGRQGNRWFNTTTFATQRLVIGLEAWLSPEVNIGTLGGVSLLNRPDLQPIRMDGANKSIKDAFIDGDVYHFTQRKIREGLAIFCTPEHIRTLSKNQQKLEIVNVERDEKGQKGKKITIRVSVFALEGMNGAPIPVIASNFVRPKTAFYGPFMSKKYGFRLKYGGKKLINISNFDNGQVFTKVPLPGVLDANGEYVAGYMSEGFIRAALICRHPNHYLVITNLDE